jgi:hypothetical protein
MIHDYVIIQTQQIQGETGCVILGVIGRFSNADGGGEAHAIQHASELAKQPGVTYHVEPILPFPKRV